MTTYLLTQSALNWLEAILQERFGLDFTLRQTTNGLSLTLANTAEGEILFPSQIIAFTQAASDLPCTQWNAAAEGWQEVLDRPLPMPGWSHKQLEALDHPLIELNKHKAIIHYDILGLTYWMLNRIEEIGRTDLDNHGRFPATSSHAFKHNYLERPVVDEWLHILGQVIQKVWPQIELKRHAFSMKVSHDVDNPSRYVFRSWQGLIRAMGGDLLRRKDIKGFIQAPFIRLTSRKNISVKDPYNTFDWLMDISEKNNLKSAFYFICGGHHANDADYQPEDKRIRALMRHIHSRGHEIGLHPSYETYQNPREIEKQAGRLRKILKEEQIEQSEIGGRMHYLRWEHPTTLQAWDDAGMAYDSTLSYADRPGFRCGTCYEYPAFNPQTQKQLTIRIRPLIAMECTIISERYMSLGYTQEALDKFLDLKEKCRRVDGNFTLLWHNSHFETKDDFRIYSKLL